MGRQDNSQTSSDHDTLIRVETKFDTFSTQVLKDIQELKDGTQLRLSATEATLQEITLWKSNITSNIRLLFAISSAIGGLIGMGGTIILLLNHII